MKPARKTLRHTRKTADSPPKSAVIAVPADCSVRNISALRDRLCEVPRSVRHITLDLHDLQRFDCATLQLIAAFTRDHGTDGTHLLIRDAPAAWAESAALLGLTLALTATADAP